MVSPRKRNNVVGRLRSSPKGKSDSQEDWIAGGSFRFTESPVIPRREVNKRRVSNMGKPRKDTQVQNRRQSCLLKRLDIQMSAVCFSPDSNIRKTRRQSIAVTSKTSIGSISVTHKMEPPKLTTSISEKNITARKMKPKLSPSRAASVKVKSPNTLTTTKKSPTTTISPMKFYRSPKKQDFSQHKSHVDSGKRKADSDVTSDKMEPTQKKVKVDSPVTLETNRTSKRQESSSSMQKRVSSSVRVSSVSKKIEKSSASPSPIGKKALRSAIPRRAVRSSTAAVSPLKAKKSASTPQKGRPIVLTSVESVKTAKSQQQNNQKKAEVSSPIKLRSTQAEKELSLSPKKKLTLLKVEGSAPKQKIVTPKKKKEMPSPENNDTKAHKREVTPKLKLRSAKSLEKIKITPVKKVKSPRKAATTVKKVDKNPTPVKKVKSPKKAATPVKKVGSPSPLKKSPPSSQLITTQGRKEDAMPSALKRSETSEKKKKSPKKVEATVKKVGSPSPLKKSPPSSQLITAQGRKIDAMLSALKRLETSEKKKSPKKVATPAKKVGSPSPLKKSPPSSQLIKTPFKVKESAPISLRRLETSLSPSMIKTRLTRSAAKSSRKVTVVGKSPQTLKSSFRKTPGSTKKAVNCDVDLGSSPLLSARTQLEMIRCSSPVRTTRKTPKVNVKPFTPKPDSPPSHKLRKVMKKKVAQKMQATTKVEVHQLMNGEISKPVQIISASKTMTASISVSQSKIDVPSTVSQRKIDVPSTVSQSKIDVPSTVFQSKTDVPSTVTTITPRKPIGSDKCGGEVEEIRVCATTPVSAANLPPTPKSSHKLPQSVHTVRTVSSRSMSKISCQRTLSAATPRSSTPIEEDIFLEPLSMGTIIQNMDKESFADDSINTDQSEDETYETSLSEFKEKECLSPEKPKRSYCVLM